MTIEDLKLNPITPLQKIEDEVTNKFKIELFIKRLDLTHPEISGNKWYKLKYNLLEAHKSGYKKLLTFGGAYSNHIYATAAAGNLFGFKTIGIIRGEEHLPLNPTLKFAEEKGMEIYYMDRKTYREKSSETVITFLQNKFGDFYLIPEGGSNSLAVKGCSEIIKDINSPFDIICTASGTGGTLAGLISGLNDNQKAMGFAALKDASFLYSNVDLLLNDQVNIFNYEINLNYHFGGYAKIKNDLLDFIRIFENNHEIQLEPIYSGKMLFGIYDLIRNSFFKKGSKIIALHNGGLQGLQGLKNKIRSLENRRDQL